VDPLPGSVLFACSENAIRSPLAEALLKAVHGRRIFVQSIGVRAGEPDPFAVIVADEWGMDLSRHRPRSFDELEDEYFDLIVSLSPEAHHRAIELTRSWPCEVEFWNMPDPSTTEGSREAVLEAYRQLRGLLEDRIDARFPAERAPSG
jgi:protein-tyrosine-phosphatase